MPFIHVRVSGSRSSDVYDAIATGMTDLMVEVLGKRAEAASVLVEPASLGTWAIGGNKAAFAAYTDVKITAGTNSAAEKREFLGQAYELLRRVLGAELSSYVYIVIHELDPNDWGYDGLSQGERKAMHIRAR